jgi:uncharacterized membrane protein
MTYLLIALLLGVIAGLRAMTPLAAVSWGAYLGLIAPAGWLAVLGYAWTPWILTALALAELVTDQLPSTPSRKVPIQFGTRIVSGAISGAAVGGAAGLWPGAALGALGAVVGTLGGAAVRARLAKAFGRDLPAALLEDVVAVGGAALLVAAA